MTLFLRIIIIHCVGQGVITMLCNSCVLVVVVFKTLPVLSTLVLCIALDVDFQIKRHADCRSDYTFQLKVASYRRTRQGIVKDYYQANPKYRHNKKCGSDSNVISIIGSLLQSACSLCIIIKVDIQGYRYIEPGRQSSSQLYVLTQN